MNEQTVKPYVAPEFSEQGINTERMEAIARELDYEGHYTMATSVRQITKQRDELVSQLSPSVREAAEKAYEAMTRATDIGGNSLIAIIANAFRDFVPRGELVAIYDQLPANEIIAALDNDEHVSLRKDTISAFAKLDAILRRKP
jgi:hypothetical protein